MPEELHGKIDTAQREIEALKGPEAAKAKIAEYRGTYINAVDSGQQSLKVAEGQLKSDEAKAFLQKSSAEIAETLRSVAERGRQIITAHEMAKESGKPAAAASLSDLSSALNAKLGGLKKAIESFRALEEIAAVEKKIKDENDKLNESDGSVSPSKIIESKKKMAGTLKGLEAKFLVSGESKSYADKLRTDHTALYKAVDSESLALTAALSDQVIVDNFAKETATLQQLLAMYEKDPNPDNLQNARSQMAKCDLKKVHDDVFGETNREGTTTYEGKFYQHLWQNIYSPAKSNFEKAEAVLKTAGADDAREKLKGIEDAINGLKDKIAEYTKKSNDINARWPEVKDAERKAYFAQEQQLLSGFAAAKALIAGIDADAKSGKISGVYFDKEMKSVELQIKKIEGYRQERNLKDRLAKEKLLKYVSFVDDKDGVRVAKFSKYFDNIKTWDDYDRIRLTIKKHSMEVKDGVKTESDKALIEAKINQGKAGIDSLKEQLGPKCEKYFDGLSKFKNRNFKGAMESFNSYTAQSFTPEELKLHSTFIENAKEMMATFAKSADYYKGMNALKMDDPKEATRLFNNYLNVALKLPAAEQALHAEQISAAREALKKVGLSQLNLLNDILEDIKELRLARNRLVGNPLLKPDENLESSAIMKKFAALRDGLATGKVTDFYSEYAKLKTEVQAMVQKKGISEDKSLLNKMDRLFEAIKGKDPMLKQKALVEFAMEARKERGYGLAKKYLEYALEDFYRDYAAQKPPKVDREDVRKKMLADPKITAWIMSAAKEQYAEMKKKGNAVGLTLAIVQQRLLNRKLDEAYRGELRRAMTKDGLAGGLYKAAAEGGSAAAALIATQHTTDAEVMAAGSPALLLYNEYFKDKPSDWYNPASWGAEDWDEFEDGCVDFVFETAMTAGIGFGAGAAGEKVGAGVLKALARRGFSRAALEAVEKGGVKVLREALKKEGTQVLKAFLMKQGASVAAEGATLFTLGTMQSFVMDPKGTVESFSSIGGGVHQFAESIVKAAVYRVIGAGGARIMGRNPTVAKILLQEVVSGIGGAAVEGSSMVMSSGNTEQITARWMAKSLIQNALQSGMMHVGRKAAARVKRPDKISAAYNRETVKAAGAKIGVDFTKPEMIKNVAVDLNGHIYIEGKPLIVDGKPVTTGNFNNIIGVLPGKSRDYLRTVVAIKKEKTLKLLNEIKAADEYAGNVIATNGEFRGINQLALNIGEGKIILTDSIANKFLESPDGQSLLLDLMGKETVRLDPRIDRNNLYVEVMWVAPNGRSRLIDLVVAGDFPLNERLINKMSGSVIDRIKLGALLENPNLKVAPGINVENLKIDTKMMDPPERAKLMEDVRNGRITLSRHLIDKLMTSDEGIKELADILGMGSRAKIESGVDMSRLKSEVNNRKQRIDDTEKLTDLRRAAGNEKAFGMLLRRQVESIASGKKPAENDVVGNIIGRLAKNDPALFEALAKGDIERIAGTEALEAMVAGRKLEFIDINGNKITAYVGKDIGKGGLGQVAEVAYIAPDGALSHAAIKRPHPGNEKPFIDEGKAQVLVQSWGEHPNIIQPLVVGKDYIIYETGPEAADMHKAYENTGGSEYFADLASVTDGLIFFHSKGYFHGDIKQANILRYIESGPDGKPKKMVKIIDNSPVDPASDIAGNMTYPKTPGYFLWPPDIGDVSITLMNRGMPEEGRRAWVGRAQDAYANGVMWADTLGYYASEIPHMSSTEKEHMVEYVIDVSIAIEKHEPLPEPPTVTNPQINAVLGFVADSLNPLKSGDPNFLQNSKKILFDFANMMKRDSLPVAPRKAPSVSGSEPTAVPRSGPTAVPLNRGNPH